jgi:hypothetical protein
MLWLPQIDLRRVPDGLTGDPHFVLSVTWHEYNCLRNKAVYEALKAEYETAWPDCCSNCQGWGYFEDTQRHDPYGEEVITDPCDCMLEGDCPRCGRFSGDEWAEGDPTPCPHCGFVVMQTAGVPHPPECTCWGYEKSRPASVTYSLDKIEALREELHATLREGEEEEAVTEKLNSAYLGLLFSLEGRLQRGITKGEGHP